MCLVNLLNSIWIGNKIFLSDVWGAAKIYQELVCTNSSWIALPWVKPMSKSEANFHFWGYFKLGTLLEGLRVRRLMSCKIALHALVTFTEQVVPIQKHITLFWIPSISGTKTVTMKPTKNVAVKLPVHTPITYLLSTSLASCNLKNGFKGFVPHIIRSNNQFSTL